jgi:hypothetical protein
MAGVNRRVASESGRDMRAIVPGRPRKPRSSSAERTIQGQNSAALSSSSKSKHFKDSIKMRNKNLIFDR